MQRGFSLIESVVVLAVLGVLVAMSISTVGDIIHGLRLAGASNDVLQQLHLARSEAVKRNSRVVLCTTADGESCASEGGWELGWLLFQDGNNTGTREPAEPVLERVRPLPPDFHLGANTPLARYVSYGPLGDARMVSGAFQAGTFTVCRISAKRGEARKIVINTAGRPRSEKVEVNSCPPPP
jgi:type IV fimbrial biogenesis protein FimT